MKIKQHHFDYLKSQIDQTLATYNQHNELVREYEHRLFSRAESTKNIQRRFCFDVLWGSGLNKFVCDNLYPYLNDDHIYTALKSICPTIKEVTA